MPDAPRHRNHVQHPDLPPPGRGSGDAVERFAEALDALVIGAPDPTMNNANDRSLAHLTATAGAIQRRDGVWMTVNGPTSATPIGEARKRQIWENLMAQYARDTSPASTGTAQAPMIGRLGALMQPWVSVDEERPTRNRRASTGLLRFVSDLQPATTFALVIAVLIAIGAAFAGIAEPGGPGVTPTASAEGLAGLTSQASPAAVSPTAPATAPTAVPGDEFQQPIPTGDGTCTVEPRPIEEIAAILRDPGPVTPRAYLPATTPDRATAEEVARAGRTYIACEYAEALNTDRALQTPRFIYEDQANAFYRETGGATDTATREEREQLATLVLGQDPWASQIIVTELAISRAEYERAAPNDAPWDIVPPATPEPFRIILAEQLDQTFRPEQAVQLADGRIAVPETFLVDPADVEAWLSADPNDSYPDIVWFYIFTRDATRDGEWGLDERLPVCLGDDRCDELYAADDLSDDALFPAPATPMATPAASPTAQGGRAARLDR